VQELVRCVVLGNCSIMEFLIFLFFIHISRRNWEVRDGGRQGQVSVLVN
jgi:hypothetical protein